MENSTIMTYGPYVTPQQSPTGTSPFPSPYTPGADNSSMPLEFVYGLNGFPDSRTMMASGGGLMTTGSSPTTPPMEGIAQDPHLITAIIQNEFKNTKRRAQNREAQRRFRERKEQRQQTLQQTSDELRSEYQTLSDQYAKSTNEVSQLLRENERLQSEVKSLRQQWHLMLTLLQQHPQGLQTMMVSSLEELVANDSSLSSPHSPS